MSIQRLHPTSMINNDISAVAAIAKMANRNRPASAATIGVPTAPGKS
ncbi:hypothetical protein [Kroppenstedtia eburnea]